MTHLIPALFHLYDGMEMPVFFRMHIVTLGCYPQNENGFAYQELLQVYC